MNLFILLIACQNTEEVVQEQENTEREVKHQDLLPKKVNPKKEFIPNPPFPGQGSGAGIQGGMKVGKHQGPSSFKAQPTFQWSSEAKENPKSIILVSLDTLQAQRMEIYGGRALTPNLKEFSNSAILFYKAISHFPETALSHWSMMTGVLPEVHGNVPANGGSIYTGPTLAEIARTQGYATAGFIGGVTMTDQSSGFARGFDVYDDKFSFKMEDMSRDGNEVTKKATEWIQKQKKPYFAFVHYFDTHFPYTPTQNLYDPGYKGVIDGSDAVLRPYRDGVKTPSARDVEHILALYDAEITELDAKIAPILRLADENTIVVVTSDHGESFSHEYYFNHRAGLWDEITHIPLLISHSEAVKIPQQVGLIDLLPTVLDLAGLPKDERMQGESKVSLLDGKGKGQEDVYSITDPWMKNPQFAVRTKNFKWIQQSNQADLFYALGEDPSEKASLKSVPKEFELKQKQYIDVISAMKEWQVEPPQKRKISDEECKRLMLLGYTTCEKP